MVASFRDAVTAWLALGLAHGRLSDRLDAALQAEYGLPLTCYEALRVIDAAAAGRVSMGELAQATQLSAAGVTRVVGRLVRDGLVVRERVGRDRRLLFARFSPAGRELFGAAEQTFLACVRRLLIEPVGADLPVVRAALERTAERAGGRRRMPEHALGA